MGNWIVLAFEQFDVLVEIIKHKFCSETDFTRKQTSTHAKAHTSKKPWNSLIF